ncbi:MAG: undecaprenyldiphospho-muramoylpentapeptide beta-N-acetylglucosaminyltransferase [Deltaproteobacteria bacterium RBG_19FT_COMBO_43_11]|nr:MAG: undecaprenyldiphospho-muramoylpentapeptide beta-N-acetylglucosaminyltransferase [Deltaproteobacteria bacterium RBG_19FT_COMBO_43_11]
MRIVIAGGGTGGHLFPGIAIAEQFLKKDDKAQVIFIGTKKGIEYKLLDKLGYELRTIDIEGLKGRGLIALAKSFYQVPQSMWQSRRILKQFSPHLVIGVGGYASGPAVLTAHFMGIPTAIAEQNAVPGVTNRILGKFVNKIFVTYAKTATLFEPNKVMLSGNPVRAAFIAGKELDKEKKDFWQLLIFGGSQGAAAINKAIIDMLPWLQKTKNKIHVVHQTGARQMEKVRQVYKGSGIKARVLPFIVDMAGAYKSADLIICRAGATSLAEITASGKAAILIPYPWAANDHQTKNAQAMAEAGAAVMIRESELSGCKLFEVIESLLYDEQKLKKMEKKSAKLGNINAAAKIVDACMKLMAKVN